MRRESRRSSQQRRRRQRRRGHRETPIVIGLICLLSVPLAGGMALARAVARAHKAGVVLDASDKWLAFARGSASALGTMLAMVAFVAI